MTHPPESTPPRPADPLGARPPQPPPPAPPSGSASPPPGPSGGPPPPPSTPAPGAAWYYGPFPPPGAPREGFGASLGKTAARGCVWSFAFGLGILATFGIVVGIVAAIVAAVGDSGGDSTDFVYGEEGSANRLLSIRVDGVILGEEPANAGGIFADPFVTYGYEVKQKLLDAALEGGIKGVVIEFSTPGGTIFGSQAIADGIREYRERTGKPVVAYIAGLSASGGVYSMVTATTILADHGSLIGSIGVRLGTIPYYDAVVATEGGILGGGVTTTNGITYTSLTAGRGKDVGSPFRRLTPEEVRVLQQGLDNAYGDFIAHVAKSRNIPEATIRDQMGALIFDNKTAQDYRLIDATANREAAYAELAKLAGLTGADWQVVRDDEEGGVLSGLFAKGDQSPPSAANRSICFPQNMILAYYGEPAALCK